jgi:hypothetical protein
METWTSSQRPISAGEDPQRAAPQYQHRQWPLALLSNMQGRLLVCCGCHRTKGTSPAVWPRMISHWQWRHNASIVHYATLCPRSWYSVVHGCTCAWLCMTGGVP